MSDQKIVITGSNGFVGGHLLRKLQQTAGLEPLPCNRSAFQSSDELVKTVADAKIVLHFAGMNRGDDQEVSATNVKLASQLVSAIRKSCAVSARKTPERVSRRRWPL